MCLSFNGNRHSGLRESLGFTFALAVFSPMLFGSFPELKYARMKASAMMLGAGRDRQRSRSVLVVAQVALALVLLVSAVLMIRTFAALRHVEPGFSDAARVETMSIFIPEQMRPMVVVSESFARENWGSAQAAIGKRVKKHVGLPWQEVIGEGEDVHVHGVDEKAPGITSTGRRCFMTALRRRLR